MCGHFCPAPSHADPSPSLASTSNQLILSSSQGGASPVRSYCQERLWHAPVDNWPTGVFMANGCISHDGHRFSCNHTGNRPHHIVFVIDRSASMGSNDKRPTIPLFRGKQNNRLGAVLQGIDQFIEYRGAMQAGDKMSLILFNDKAEILVTAQDMDRDMLRQEVQNGNMHPDDVTEFGVALCGVAHLLNAVEEDPSVSHLPPVVLFLSDGVDLGNVDIEHLMGQLKAMYPRLTLHTTVFGDGGTGATSLLRNMAAWGGGQFSESLDEIQLSDNLRELARSMRDATATLM